MSICSDFCFARGCLLQNVLQCCGIQILSNEYINDRENRRDNQEWTIQKHWQRWAHKTQNKDKQSTKTQHRKLKWGAIRTPLCHRQTFYRLDYNYAWVTRRIRSRNSLPLASIWVYPRVFCGVRIAPHFSFLCCVVAYPITTRSRPRLYIVIKEIAILNRTQTHNTLNRLNILITLITSALTYCVFFYRNLQILFQFSMLCLLFCLSLFCVLCVQRCQCFRIVHSWLLFWFSLRFIQ
jgi:hypothetical protein